MNQYKKPCIWAELVKWFFYVIQKHELMTQCLVAVMVTIAINLLIG